MKIWSSYVRTNDCEHDCCDTKLDPTKCSRFSFHCLHDIFAKRDHKEPPSACQYHQKALIVDALVLLQIQFPTTTSPHRNVEATKMGFLKRLLKKLYILAGYCAYKVLMSIDYSFAHGTIGALLVTTLL